MDLLLGIGTCKNRLCSGFLVLVAMASHMSLFVPLSLMLFGVGWVVGRQKESIKTIKRLVASYVPSASLLSNVGAEISFQLPNDASPSFKAMLTEIDARKDELGLGRCVCGG